MKKLIPLAALALALLSATTPAHAQSTVQVISPFTCVDQYSFYCYNVPVTVNGQAAFLTLDIFSGNVGYVSLSSPYSYNTIISVQIVSLNSLGQISEMKVGFTSVHDPDRDGDSDTLSGVLDLTVTWKAQSSGGGRGSHNVIWRPVISGGGSYTVAL